MENNPYLYREQNKNEIKYKNSNFVSDNITISDFENNENNINNNIKNNEKLKNQKEKYSEKEIQKPIHFEINGKTKVENF